jgi:hypothetical protein
MGAAHLGFNGILDKSVSMVAEASVGDISHLVEPFTKEDQEIIDDIGSSSIFMEQVIEV